MALLNIPTGYDPSLGQNRKANFGKTGNQRLEDTERERKYAEKAEVATALEDFSHKIIYIVGNRRVSINDTNGKPMIIVIPDLPETLRNRTMAYLRCAFPGRLENIDSKIVSADYNFESIYITWYNRYSKRGDGVSPDIEPSAHIRKGKKRQFKTAQCIPRTSKEFQANMKEYLILQDCFREIFDFIEQAIREVLPDEYKDLAQFAEMVSKANGTNKTSKSQLAKSQLPPPESRNPVLQIRSSTKDARFGFIPEEEGDEESDNCGTFQGFRTHGARKARHKQTLDLSSSGEEENSRSPARRQKLSSTNQENTQEIEIDEVSPDEDDQKAAAFLREDVSRPEDKADAYAELDDELEYADEHLEDPYNADGDSGSDNPQEHRCHTTQHGVYSQVEDEREQDMEQEDFAFESLDMEKGPDDDTSSPSGTDDNFGDDDEHAQANIKQNPKQPQNVLQAHRSRNRPVLPPAVDKLAKAAHKQKHYQKKLESRQESRHEETETEGEERDKDLKDVTNIVADLINEYKHADRTLEQEYNHDRRINIVVFDKHSNFRQLLKDAGKDIVSTHYKSSVKPDCTDTNSDQVPELVKREVNRILHRAAFAVHPKKDGNGKTQNVAHPAIKDLIETFFYKGKGSLASSYPADFREKVPENAILLAITCYSTPITWDGDKGRDIQSSYQTLVDKIKANEYHGQQYEARRADWARQAM
ncbi:hypothetical protein HYPSUDRAFT_203038 [Hypholoma sublateritium FD-334 SS-4]|uniref:DUF6532 domain-containing protein n=1 Tax=Hypholoma sublateritium (strain FD-334 SS-4) TaxID=945553 RepID=A0A0D2L3D1_HYPSF|nr:hypothetical protein HYPSUDRAFT_203038 [Hypholoma sublateritium FD-334 SS-4]